MQNNILLANPAGDEKLYVEDVFSTYLYTGNTAAQTIRNNIALVSGGANNTNLHLTGDAIIDSSPIPKTLSVSGSVTVNTTTKKYGTGSLYFDGSSKINVTPSTSAASLSEDCTIECWIYPTTLFNEGIWGFSNASTGDCYLQWYVNNLYLKFGNIYTTVAATSASLLNTWTHIAVVRFNNVVTVYINGVGTNVGTITTNPTVHTYFSVGDGCFNNIIPFDGYIDDLRVSQRAVYTANFTPPTAALPLDTLVTSQGGMVWLKSRSNGTASYSHGITDTVRGAGKELITSSTAAQSANSWIGSFLPNGFTVLPNGTSNVSPQTYVSWTFRKAPKFFDIVTYTGDGSTMYNRWLNHSLGVVPGMVFVKCTGTLSDWGTWCRLTNTTVSYNMYLNTTGANAANLTLNAHLTSTSFRIPEGLNVSGQTYVAYVFAHDPSADGIIQCGSTTGSGAGTVTLGWEPQYLILKDRSSGYNWGIYDATRNLSMANVSYLLANTTAAEATEATYRVTITPTGFTYPTNFSTASGFVYMAIRRGPMRTPTDATKVFHASTASGVITTGFPVDLNMIGFRTGNAANAATRTRLIGGAPYIVTSSTAAETGTTDIGFTSNTGLTYSMSTDWINWNFRRAPGFFDVVCYTGTGSARTVSHNLGVAPEMMVVKGRSAAAAWNIYDAFNGPTKYLRFTTAASTTFTSSYFWNNTAPTSTVFSLSSDASVNASGTTYVAYLFASCPGVSKVGSYTGNGSSLDIDCGFTNGARFVLIKRTDSTGDWFTFDTARGIVTGNDPHLSLNSTAAEVTTNDSIDPLSTGFTVNQVAATNINVNAATYIYLAIA